MGEGQYHCVVDRWVKKGSRDIYYVSGGSIDSLCWIVCGECDGALHTSTSGPFYDTVGIMVS